MNIGITNFGSTAYSLISRVITSDVSQVTAQVVVSVIALNIIYGFADAGMKKVYELSNARISDDFEIPQPIKGLVEFYKDFMVKKVVQYLGNHERQFYKQLSVHAYAVDPFSYQSKFLCRSINDPFLVTNIVSPLLEEFAYRFPATYLSPSTLKTITMLVSSIAFGFAHPVFQPGRRTALILNGLFLAGVASNFGLTTAIGAHIGFNLLNWIMKD